MNNDRELLELAARAAGYKYTIWVDNNNDYDSPHYQEPCFCEPAPWDEKKPYELSSWNSLTNNGDAFCLAVKLKIGQIWALTQWSDMDFEEATEAYAADPYAATRRAITRAAAEIGKAL